MGTSCKTAILVITFLAVSASAQQQPAQPDQDMKNMPGMQAPGSQQQDQGMPNMPGMGPQKASGSMEPKSFVETILQHTGSGTSMASQSAPSPMWMAMRGNWSLMLHGDTWIGDIQQSGPRGFDKFFSTDWFMPMAQHDLGPGRLTLRTMLSLEPATVTERRYPELFQLGETAYGKPIVDGQHPHDFFMEIAAMYDLKLGENALLSFYAAPVGDPAMGPVAYPHRISASEDPIAPLGHHLEDSTHIADDVITVGLTYKLVRIEASGFHGREPNENRWNIDGGRLDSWSTRLTLNPAVNWSLQYSFAFLTSPEMLFPASDVRRMTASLTYNLPLSDGNWASTLLWGRNSEVYEHGIFNGYLAESTLRLGKNFVWGRIENVDRSNELILGEAPLPPGFQEQFLARVQAYALGYGREIGHVPHFAIAPGAQVTFYGKPAFLTPIYGDHPVGVVVFLRIRPTGSH